MIDLHPPDSEVAHALGHLCKQHHVRIQSLVGELGLYRGQPLLLAVLWEHEGFTHSELAEQLSVTPATITKMLQRMELSGFVSRQPDPNDQRISRVYLTERGREVREKVDAIFRTMEAEILVGFEARERDALLDYLQRIGENLAHVAAHASASADEGAESRRA